jgi:hypothetical protein
MMISGYWKHKEQPPHDTSFEHLRWPCRANVRKTQKVCCSKGRALWTKSTPPPRVSVLQTEASNLLSDQVVPYDMKGLGKRRPRLFSQFYRTPINVEWLRKTNKSLPFEKSQYPWGEGGGANAPSILFFLPKNSFLLYTELKKGIQKLGWEWGKGVYVF